MVPSRERHDPFRSGGRCRAACLEVCPDPLSRCEPVRQEKVEYAERCRLRKRAGVSDRPDTARAAVLARAFGNQPPGGVEQLVMHAVQRHAETDAAWVVVVDEDTRTLLFRVDRYAHV